MAGFPTILSDRWACRRRTAAGWVANDEILYKGEIGLVSDNGRFKFGDGVTAYASLLFSGIGKADLTGLANGSALVYDSGAGNWIVGGPFATQAYVDAALAGLSWKQAVRVATTVAGTLASSFENGDTVDGVVLATGNRILIKNQAAPADNGIYTVNASGAPTRSADANSGAELVNASVYVSEGTANADTQWTCTTNAPITVGSTSIVFAQLSSGGGITALTGDVTASGTGSVAATLATAQSAVHTWAAAQTFTVAPVFTDQSGSRTALGLGAMATKATVATADIDADAVTNAKLANMATQTFKGRTTGGTGDPEDLSVAQAKALLGITGGSGGDGGTDLKGVAQFYDECDKSLTTAGWSSDLVTGTVAVNQTVASMSGAYVLTSGAGSGNRGGIYHLGYSVEIGVGEIRCRFRVKPEHFPSGTQQSDYVVGIGNAAGTTGSTDYVQIIASSSGTGNWAFQWGCAASGTSGQATLEGTLTANSVVNLDMRILAGSTPTASFSVAGVVIDSVVLPNGFIVTRPFLRSRKAGATGATSRLWVDKVLIEQDR